MVRTGQDVTDAELVILRVLWSQGRCTIRQITEQVYPNNSDSDYATVKKLLSRLENKNFVLRHRGQTAHSFEPLVTRDELVERRLKELADDLCNGSQTPLLMTLLQNREVSPKQQKVLKELIKQFSTGSSRGPSKKGRKDD